MWVRAHRREILLAALFFLITSTAFGAGYLFARDYTAAPIVIEKGS